MYCPDTTGAIHRTHGSGEGDTIVAQSRPGTSVAAAPLGDTNIVLAYVREATTSEGAVREGMVTLNDGPPVRLSEEGSGATSIELVERGLPDHRFDGRCAGGHGADPCARACACRAGSSTSARTRSSSWAGPQSATRRGRWRSTRKASCSRSWRWPTPTMHSAWPRCSCPFLRPKIYRWRGRSTPMVSIPLPSPLRAVSRPFASHACDHRHRGRLLPCARDRQSGTNRRVCPQVHPIRSRLHQGREARDRSTGRHVALLARHARQPLRATSVAVTSGSRDGSEVESAGSAGAKVEEPSHESYRSGCLSRPHPGDRLLGR